MPKIPQIKVIAFEASSKSLYSKKEQEGYTKHFNRSSDDQLQHLADKINLVMKELINQTDYDPADKIIITWQEHGITHFENDLVDNSCKKKFKLLMLELTKKHPNLTISGNLYFQKEVDLTNDPLKKDRILKGYDTNKWLHESDGDYQYLQHEYQSNHALNSSRKVIIVRNILYIFENGKVKTVHDKKAPYKEFNFKHRNWAFQTGSKKGNPSVIYIGKYPVGLEICREHAMGVLKRVCGKFHFDNPYIQLIVSAAVKLNEENICGENVIHVDSNIETSHNQTVKPDPNKSPVRLYKTNLYDLKDPIKSVLPTPMYLFNDAKSKVTDEMLSEVDSDGNNIMHKIACKYIYLSFKNKASHLDQNKFGSLVNMKNSHNQTPLDIAMKYNNTIFVVQYLYFEKFVNPSANFDSILEKDSNGNNIIHRLLLAPSTHFDMTYLMDLYQHHPNNKIIDEIHFAKNNKRQTMLHIAIEKNLDSFVDEFLMHERNQKINYRLLSMTDNNKNNALHLFAKYGIPAHFSDILIKLSLEEKTALFLSKNKDGKYPMDGSKENHLLLLNEFLNFASEKSIQAYLNNNPYLQKINPLDFAIMIGNMNAIQNLVNDGADINTPKPNTELPPFMRTIAFENYEALNILLSGKQKINIDQPETMYGWTAIMMAVKTMNISIIKLLLKLSPDISIKNKMGETVYDIAKTTKNLEVIRLIEKYKSRRIINILKNSYSPFPYPRNENHKIEIKEIPQKHVKR